MIFKSSSYNGNNVLVLLSGGIDSTACVEFYHSQGVSLRALFLEYGQLSVVQEAQASTQVCQHYRIPLSVVSCIGANRKMGGVIDGRNAFLLYAALMEFRMPSGIIAIGIHAGTSYFDCSKKFIQSIQATFDNYTNGRMRVGVPFLEWGKTRVADYYLDASWTSMESIRVLKNENGFAPVMTLPLIVLPSVVTPRQSKKSWRAVEKALGHKRC